MALGPENKSPAMSADPVVKSRNAAGTGTTRNQPVCKRPVAGYRVPLGSGGTAMSTVKELLQKLDLGKSVAEFDEDLEDYFVETEAFRSLVDDRVDIIAGDKGTGKTAIFRILEKRFPTIDKLRNVEVVPAFNPRGSSIFEKLGQEGLLTESEYNDMWKAYFLALVGNWILSLWEERARLVR